MLVTIKKKKSKNFVARSINIKKEVLIEKTQISDRNEAPSSNKNIESDEIIEEIILNKDSKNLNHSDIENSININLDSKKKSSIISINNPINEDIITSNEEESEDVVVLDIPCYRDVISISSEEFVQCEDDFSMASRKLSVRVGESS